MNGSAELHQQPLSHWSLPPAAVYDLYGLNKMNYAVWENKALAMEGNKYRLGVSPS